MQRLPVLVERKRNMHSRKELQRMGVRHNGTGRSLLRIRKEEEKWKKYGD